MKHPVTPRGYATLRQELQRLKAMRPELAHAIEVARGHGDLSENADYDAAKERSGMIEAKIRDLESRLANAQVIDPNKISLSGKVVFGATVILEEPDSGEQKKISIYGTSEADIDRGWISIESPLARAIIGKEEGEVVRVSLPGGIREYEIREVTIEYDPAGAPAELADAGVKDDL